MKFKSLIFGLLIATLFGFACYEYSWAQAGSDDDGFKVGIVSVREIFEKGKRNTNYREQAQAEQQKLIAELEKLEKEIDAQRAGLKTLVRGSEDYLELSREIMEKEANLQAQQEFYKQQLALKDQKWTEDLYKDILAAAKEIADAKGLDMVFESDQITLPAPSANELMLTIRTHKILYYKDALDITDEVMEKVDLK